MSDSQFVKVSFGRDDKRTYTYKVEGERLAIGDTGEVADRHSGKPKRVEVVGICGEPPKFECKPIRKYVPPPVDAGAGDDDDYDGDEE